MLWKLRFWASKTRGQASGFAQLPEPLAGLLTDAGCRREQNEDAARIVRAGSGPHGNRGLLLVVADGMGGHEAGEVASQAAVEMIEREYREARGTPGDALARAFRTAHNQILLLAAANAALSGMGTTCTALAIVGWKAWAAHVGDSRLYLIRGNGIYQLSEDHTQCMEMVRKGLLTLEEARRHEDRNVLARAMGTRSELALMTWPAPMTVKAGDSFVLCSDGLHDLVGDGEIRNVVEGAAPQSACQRLVKMARERGGYDNITVAIAAIPAANGIPAPLKATRECEANV
jgi:serine/threonine protein phosphatase PrpC